MTRLASILAALLHPIACSRVKHISSLASPSDSVEALEPSAPEATPFGVNFYLMQMHSYFSLPTCEVLEPKFGVDIPQVLRGLDKCGAFDTGNTTRVDAHWNVEDCAEKVCFVTADAPTLEPLVEPLKMHPACAWGVALELASAYDTSFRGRNGSFFGLAGPIRALGRSTMNPRNLLAAKQASKTDDPQEFATKIANMVRWRRKLSTRCSWPRSRNKILSKEAGSGVCWNFVIDFRDLWCHYRRRFDINDAAACRAAFAPVLDNAMNQPSDPEWPTNA
eukprot:TRINITY_DN73635_c0_g1_i1.p1 TRINITY_DN73635_c0_g1~~TRINITY_DN73635_c0_g1_i1.p1  ORF type:complete len:278 (-),score=36.56 TRINITY_DN73635_c0_g1_i1:68-901(-)